MHRGRHRDPAEGPFEDHPEAPLVCQRELGGSIDPYPYRDADGRLYLFWKNDGNCCAQPVHLWVQPLADDGRRSPAKRSA